MYLHRYTHIQSIHPYINRLVHMDLHIPGQCMDPPEEQLTATGGEISVTVVLTSLQSTVSKVTDVGLH